MDKITKSLLDSFVKENDLEKLEESKQFEHFTNYSIISKLYRSSFELSVVSTGDGGDGAIDGLAIIVNGKLIESVDELDDITTNSSYLDCDIVFIQSKTSSKFEGSEIGSFIFGVKDFISDKPKLVHNEDLVMAKDIWEAVINKSAYMINHRPNCKLYYATTGKWVNDKNLLAVISSGVDEITDTGLFEDVSFLSLGANEMQKYYHETRNKLSATVTFLNRITLDDISGVKEAYLGILPFKEFLHLIQDENQTIYNIFDYNIRDFLGENEINKKIKQTLIDRKFDLFCVLNNGVTIVSSSITPAGNRFTLRDYQIVNGCQTSNVLHESRGIAGIDSLCVPVKIIVTEDEDIRNEITIATNSQTEVKPEQLEALNQFQKRLELYYNSVKGPGHLYYERRTQQFHSTQGVKKAHIITIPIQIKSFASAFLNVPHAVSGYYGTIATRFKGKMFGSDHKYSPYYASALCYQKLAINFRLGIIDSKFKKIKFHLIMLARMIAMGIDLPPISSDKIDALSEGFITTLNDDDKSIQLLEEASQIFEKSGLDISQKQFKAESETETLIKTLKKHISISIS